MNLFVAIYLGKVNPRHNCCYIPWGGEEHSKEEYDVSFRELIFDGSPFILKTLFRSWFLIETVFNLV